MSSKNKVTAILTADVHLRDSSPECRTDDFMQAQLNKHKYISKLQQDHDCPVIVAGDIFHHWKPSPYLLAWALRNMTEQMHTIAGQHDLPAHSLDNIHKSGYQVLCDSGKIRDLLKLSPCIVARHTVMGFPFGSSLDIPATHKNSVAVIHHLVYRGKEPFPGASAVGGSVSSVIKKLNSYKLIVSGDNHVSFCEKVGDTLLVNPGSIMRSTAAQVDHKPSVYLWYAEENEVERVYLPAAKDVVNRTHIDVIQERDERMDAYVSKLRGIKDISLSYTDNMLRFIAKNKVEYRTTSIIKKAMGL